MKIFKILAIVLSTLMCLIRAQTNNFSCSQVTPKSPSDCTSQSTNTGNYCCYLSQIQATTSSSCISIPKVSYDGGNTYYYNGKNSNIDCGKDTQSLSTNILKTCGTPDAASKSDCSTGSSFVESCCWYKGTGATNTPPPKAGCYWLGTKYSGDTTWAGMPLSCSSTYLTFSFSLILLFLIFMF